MNLISNSDIASFGVREMCFVSGAHIEIPIENKLRFIGQRKKMVYAFSLLPLIFVFLLTWWKNSRLYFVITINAAAVTTT